MKVRPYKMSLFKKVLIMMVSVIGFCIYFLCRMELKTLAAEETESAEAEEIKPPGDTTPPSVNAAVNNGKLTITAVDESGIKAIYVNDYEFLDPEDGELTIRLEKFEAGLESFTIAAMDGAGNKTEKFEIVNPYWSDPENKKTGTEDPAEELPADASPSEATGAEGVVTDHVYTDENGNIIESEDPEALGREFYTISADTGKIFYLIIERTSNGEIVHFTTDISENDLLNVTEDNSKTLPKNSIAAPSGVPVSEVRIATDDGGEIKVSPEGEKTVTDKEGNIIESVVKEEAPVKKEKPGWLRYLYIGLAALGLFIILYYFKIHLKKKKGGFVEDEKAEDEKESSGGDDVLIGGDPLEKHVGDDDFFDEDD